MYQISLFHTVPMDHVLRDQIRAWKVGMELHNQIVLDEKRNQTPTERLKSLMAFLGAIPVSALSEKNLIGESIGCPTAKYRSAYVIDSPNVSSATSAALATLADGRFDYALIGGLAFYWAGTPMDSFAHIVSTNAAPKVSFFLIGEFGPTILQKGVMLSTGVPVSYSSNAFSEQILKNMPQHSGQVKSDSAVWARSLAICDVDRFSPYGIALI